MPKVMLNPQNQCTLDDPSDGADLPSVAPNATPSNGAPPAPAPMCLASEPEHSECANELVLRFGQESTPAFAPAPPAPPAAGKSCGSEMVSAASSCGAAAYKALKKEVDVAQIASCVGNIAALAMCELEGN